MMREAIICVFCGATIGPPHYALFDHITCGPPATETGASEAEVQRQARALHHHFWRLKQDIGRLMQAQARRPSHRRRRSVRR
jgi:hypothetical protein